MKRRRSPLAMVAALLALGPLIALRASADPASPASAATSATASNVPRPAVSGSAALALPRFQDDLPAEDKTKAPTPAEWETGTPIRFDRPLPPDCSTRKLREWVRVHCNHMGARLAFIAGDPEGYSGFLPGIVKDAYDQVTIPAAFDIQLPLRRGERKVIAVDRAIFGYNSLELQPDFFLSAYWLPPAAPRLVIQRRE